MRIRVKACRKIPWIAMALQIKTRLWLGGVVGDASRIAFWPMPCSIWLSSVARPLQELLVVTAGWAAYPKSIRRVFREKALRQARQGRSRHAFHSVEMLEARDVACWLYLQLLLAPSRARADKGNRT